MATVNKTLTAGTFAAGATVTAHTRSETGGSPGKVLASAVAAADGSVTFTGLPSNLACEAVGGGRRVTFSKRPGGRRLRSGLAAVGRDLAVEPAGAEGAALTLRDGAP